MLVEGEGIEIRLLVNEDLAAAMRLKEEARWNQTEADWRRLLRHDPEGCFAASIDGRVVATTTTTAYGRELAWIGMVLVAPEYRRRGIANRLVRTALEHLNGMRVKTVKLDATPEGRAVYESLGFETELLIERWAGVARAGAESGCRQTGVSSLSGLFELDRRAFGADRSKLLKALMEDSCVEPLSARAPDGSSRGYALARRGTDAFYVGPLVATDKDIATGLLDGVLERLAGRQVYIDLNTSFEGGARELAARGFVKQRELIRMRFGESSGAGTSGAVFAIAGPEVG